MFSVRVIILIDLGWFSFSRPRFRPESDHRWQYQCTSTIVVLCLLRSTDHDCLCCGHICHRLLHQLARFHWSVLDLTGATSDLDWYRSDRCERDCCQCRWGNTSPVTNIAAVEETIFTNLTQPSLDPCCLRVLLTRLLNVCLVSLVSPRRTLLLVIRAGGKLQCRVVRCLCTVQSTGNEILGSSGRQRCHHLYAQSLVLRPVITVDRFRSVQLAVVCRFADQSVCRLSERVDLADDLQMAGGERTKQCIYTGHIGKHNYHNVRRRLLQLVLCSDSQPSSESHFVACCRIQWHLATLQSVSGWIIRRVNLFTLFSVLDVWCVWDGECLTILIRLHHDQKKTRHHPMKQLLIHCSTQPRQTCWSILHPPTTFIPCWEMRYWFVDDCFSVSCFLLQNTSLDYIDIYSILQREWEEREQMKTKEQIYHLGSWTRKIVGSFYQN